MTDAAPGSAEASAETTADAVRQAFANQIAYCRANDAPITARVVEAINAALDKRSAFGRAVLGWEGRPLADALPLRCAGGFHALHLSGAELALAPLYAGDQAALDDAPALIAAALERHHDRLMPWLDSPPQTNEAGRSASFIAAMLWLADKGLPPRFQCLEIGSSAGINLMLDRYRYDLGGVTVGPDAPVMAFAPEWKGAPPPARSIGFAGIKGCDIAPVDLADPAQALRLRAYVWPEHQQRFARLDAAVRAASECRPDLVQASAADFAEAELVRPQAEGSTRVLMHSIVWQYVPRDQQARVTNAMEAAGAAASAERPLAWIALEANRNNFRHELVVRFWQGQPGDGEPVKLAEAHAHGAWIAWQG